MEMILDRRNGDDGDDGRDDGFVFPVLSVET